MKMRMAEMVARWIYSCYYAARSTSARRRGLLVAQFSIT
jgi:hypothetical protein